MGGCFIFTPEGNVLHLDYLGESEGPITYEDGTYIVKLQYADDGEKIITINDSEAYEMTRAQIDAYGYAFDEYLFD